MNEKKQQFKRKRTIVLLMVMAMNMVFIFTACSSGKAEMSASETDTTKEETVKKEVEEASTPEPTAEPTPEPTTEPVEMVSWEEWASQPGEEEPHLVVWNEEKGKQLIIEPGSIYTMEDGDKLAVSDLGLKVKDEDMSAVVIVRDGETITPNIIVTDYGQYWDIDIPKGESDIVYTFKDQSYCYYIE